MLQYCDDTTLGQCIRQEQKEIDIRKLQMSLNKVYDWSKNRNLIINPNKSMHLRFSNKHSKEEVEYTINNNKISTNQCTKILGLSLDDKLLFHYHVESLINRANKTWYSVWKSVKQVRWQVLRNLYCTYVMPIMEQLNMVWTPTTKQYKQIESIQRKCTKQIVYSDPNTRRFTYMQRLELLKLDSTWSRYQQKKIMLVFDMRHGRYHNIKCLNELIKFTNTRKGSLVDIPRTRLFQTDRSPIIDASKIFNRLPQDIRNITKRAEFKNKIRLYFNEIFNDMMNQNF